MIEDMLGKMSSEKNKLNVFEFGFNFLTLITKLTMIKIGENALIRSHCEKILSRTSIAF